ncbi:HlyD family efflux transporter periplasmic adaptor subunit [Methanococcoides sp. SA1]|nr:HlyD family efflux transporter periplasmic adaptor subunit [Methanococcoides sp. SA1]
MRSILKILIFITFIITSLFANLNNPKQENIVITLSGELASENSTSIKAPWYWHRSYKITYLADEGSMVEKGDTVVAFDTKEIEERRDAILQELEQLGKSFEEKLLTNEQAIRDIENSIQTQEIQKQIVLGQVEQSKYNSQTEQQDRELELKKVELNIKKTKQSLKSQKVLNKNSENESRIRIEQKKSQINDYKRLFAQMNLTAPKSGIVIYHRTGRRGKGPKVKVGDEVRPTSKIIDIPELDNMIAKVELNEVDLSKIHIGQPAKISVLAYPDSLFQGKINYISKIADKNDDSKLRIYPVNIKIDGKSDYRLKPGLTVKIDLVIDSISDSYSVPSWCIFKDEDGYYVREKSKNIPVEIVKIYDGKAYILGKLNSEMQLTENKDIPNF